MKRSSQPPPVDEGRPDLSSLGLQIRRGIAWKTLSSLTTQLSRTAVVIVLARLLTPADFGVAGMALVFTGLIIVFADLGLSASLIQYDSLTEADRSTAFWTTVLGGLCLFGLGFAMAPYVANFYGNDDVRWMFVVVSTGFLTTALSTTQSSLLVRSMNFRALEIRNMLSTAASCLIGIAGAIAGFGPWSLILQTVSYSVISTCLVWMLSPWRPRFVYSVQSLRRLGSFSTNVLFSRFLYYVGRNADNILVARFLGASALGIYSIGYSAIRVPLDRLLVPLQTVLTPAFAQIRGDLLRMRRLWLRGMRLGATIIFPATIGLIILARDAVNVILGEPWGPAVPVIQILAAVILVQSLNLLNGAVFQSRFRSGLLFRMTLFEASLDLIAFAVGLHWGVVGVAAAYGLVNAIVIVPLNLVVVSRLMGMKLYAIVEELRGVIEATVVMSVGLVSLRVALSAVAFPPVLRLVASIGVGVLIYGLMCYWRERRVFAELRRGRLRDLSLR